MELLIAAAIQPREAAGENPHYPGVRFAAELLSGNTDGELVVAISVGVSGGQRSAKAIPGLTPATNHPGPLAVDPIPRSRSGRGAVDDLDQSGPVGSGDADGEIVETVVVEGANRHRLPETSGGGGAAFDPR